MKYLYSSLFECYLNTLFFLELNNPQMSDYQILIIHHGVHTCQLPLYIYIQTYTYNMLLNVFELINDT